MNVAQNRRLARLKRQAQAAEKYTELKAEERTLKAQLLALRGFLDGLRDAGEPGSSLLDRTAVVYGTCMGNANGHTNKNWPMLLVGGGFRHGRHLAFDKDRNEPIGKLFVSLLQRMGVETNQFGDSNEVIDV